MKLIDVLALCAAFVTTLVAGCGGGGGGGGGPGDTPRTIAFSREVGDTYDLYLVQEDGSGERALVTAPGSDFFLRFSNGRVLFTRLVTDSVGRQNRDLYSIRPDGSSLIALADSEDWEQFYVIAGDGRVIFARIVGNQGDLYSVRMDGTDRVALANSADGELFNLVTADGRVVFTRVAGGGSQYDLYSVKTDGTGLVALATSPDAEINARATADGRIVFERGTAVDRRDLWIVNSDGTGLRQLTNQPGEAKFLAQSPSGRLIFEVRSTAGATRHDVYSIGLDGTGLAALAAQPEDERFGDFSSDGRVIFSRSFGGQDDLFIVNEDGTGLMQLTDSLEHDDVAFSADGYVYFLRGTANTRDLYRVPADGSTAAQQLVASVFDLSYSPEQAPGWMFVSVRTGAGDANLQVMRLDGSAATVLASSLDDEWLVDVIDSGRVLISRNPPGSLQEDLYVVNLDGTGLRPLATGPTQELFGGIF
jgi:Tol biopolymer transport system component